MRTSVAALIFAFAAPALAQQGGLKTQIVGSWDTVSVIQQRADGTKLDLFNGKVSGLSIYTADGHFSQVNFQTDRPKIASGNRQTATPDEALANYKQMYAIFGTYTVNESEGTYTLKITGSSFPNEVCNTQVRKFSINGDQMVFTNPAPASGGTGAVNTLKRAK
jgi:hypothetical protein